MLIAILAEEKSYAMYSLRRQGVERLDVLTFVSHGLGDSASSRGITAENDETKNSADVLAKYTVDLTAHARAGKIDPLVGRGNAASDREHRRRTRCGPHGRHPCALFPGGSGRVWRIWREI